MVNDLTTTTILLVVGIVLLWMAITDKLGRLLDAYDVITGKATASGSSSSQTSGPPAVPGASSSTVALGAHSLALPSLPPPSMATLHNAQVPFTYYQGVQA